MVIFLDDLQWIDSASLQLLKYMMTDAELGYLLIIGTYRDNEVTSEHPLKLFQQELENNNEPLPSIALSPLKQRDIQNLLADSLNCSMDKVQELAHLLLEKTQGNPYFINEILKKLYRDQILIFSFEKRQWVWEISRIRQENITDNVVDLVLDRIQQLSQSAQSTLKLASCSGYAFNLRDLAIISKKTSLEIAKDLWEAAEHTLIRPTGKHSHLAERLGLVEALSLTENIAYSFSHDRIHKAAYQLIDAAERQRLHLTIGRLFIRDTPFDEGSEKLFEIVDHFNQALSLIEETREKNCIAQANLWAGRKAKASSAYKIATTYLRAGISLLPEHCWTRDYPLCFALYRELAESELILLHFDEGKVCVDLLLQNASSTLDQVEVYKLQAFMWFLQSNNTEGILSYLQALLRLGIKLPRHPNPIQIVIALLKIKLTMRFKSLENFKLKKAEMPNVNSISDIVEKSLKPAYALDQDFFGLILFSNVQLSLKQGYSPGTPALFLAYGCIMIHKLKWVNEGRAFIRLAEAIPEKITPASYFMLGVVIGPWRESLENCRNYFLKGHQEALNTGDLSVAMDCLATYTTTTYTMGRPLMETAAALQRKAAFSERFNFKDPFFVTQACALTIKVMTEGIDPYLDKIINVKSQLRRNEHKTDSSNVLIFYAGLLYILGLFDQSRLMGEEYLKWRENNLGIFSDLECHFYYALALSALHTHANSEEKRGLMKKLEALHKKFTWWVKLSPQNAVRYERLIAAELARVKGERAKAEDFYHQATVGAAEAECLHLMGIANECAGQFYLSLNNTHIAKAYLQKSHYAYSRWGATTKTRLMEEKYPGYFHSVPEASYSAANTSASSLAGGTSLTSIDVLSLLKSTQVISSEILLKPLLQKLLVVLLQNAGAQRGVILMKEGASWFVKAEGTTKFQQITSAQEEPAEKRLDIPLTLINYAQRTEEKVLIQETNELEPYLVKDAYLTKVKPQSVLVLPIPYQGQVRSLLYLENKTTSRAFMPECLQTLELLASQVSISLENARLYHQATHDPLTGLANRNLLHQMFTRATSHAKRGKKIVAVFFMDLDKFKSVNDTLGHEAGDKVLLYVAEHLKTYLRDSDLAVRLGGDEFVLLLENMKDKDQVIEIANRILKSLEAPIYINGQPISIGASIGISLYPQDANDISVLLKQADTALYQVKESGRGHYLFYTQELEKGAGNVDRDYVLDGDLG